ncbi:hypothetical protein CDD83_1529 [Cordyceps sp. RAO-2017]|nr:hypothetical protein CDD83_1529 [Cordyceps sp. RAO-2017]
MPSITNIANMCSHLQNASKAGLGITSVKNTKYNLALALAMQRAGFFTSVYRAGPHPPSMEEMISQTPEVVTNVNVAKMRLWLGMRYWKGKPVLSKLKPLSTPKRLLTVHSRQLHRLMLGEEVSLRGGVFLGLNVGECMFVSTSQGVMEIREAWKREIGGLLMCRAQ